MKHTRNLAAILVLLSFNTLFASAAQLFKKPRVQEERAAVPSTSMSIWQARKAVFTGLTAVMPSTLTWRGPFGDQIGLNVKMHPDTIRVSATRVDCAAEVSDWSHNWTSRRTQNPHMESCELDLRTVGTLSIREFRRQYGLSESGKRNSEGLLGKIAWDTPDKAQVFADAVNRLRAAVRGEDLETDLSGWLDLQQKAAAWRALAVKPAISEDVRKHRLLAENAVKERQFDAAIEEYEAGLEIDPVWPEGHFNSALLAAELGYYSWAIRHMRCYLELLPDAPDAQSARDQMVIWQAKIKQ